MQVVLPSELQTQILLLACRADEEDAKPISSLHQILESLDPPGFEPVSRTWALTYDPMALQQLMVLNRAFYAIGATLLYRSIAIYRPSQLSLLLRTLTERPILGKSIKHLYIGAVNLASERLMHNLAAGFASYEQAFGIETDVQRVRTYHACTSKGSLLPHAMELDMAEVLAIQAGPAEAQGIDIRHPRMDLLGDTISLHEWVLRLYEARACLHWLRMLVRDERARELRRWHASPYNVEARTYTLRAGSPHAMAHVDSFEHHGVDTSDPFSPRPLHLRRAGTRHDPMDWADAGDILFSLPASDDDVHITLVWHVLQELDTDILPRWLSVLVAKALAYGRWLAMDMVREHTPTPDVNASDLAPLPPAWPFFERDRFDDICLYAHSGVVHWVCLTDGEEPVIDEADANVWASTGRHGEQAIWESWPRFPFGISMAQWQVPLRGSTALPYVPSPPQHTLGGLVQSVQALLGMTPELEVLGLSGVLERAVAGHRASVALPRLRWLSVGPPPLFWAHALQWGDASHTLLTTLRHISVTGYMLLGDEARALGGVAGTLPHLTSVTWSMHLGAMDHGGVGVIAAMAIILGVEIPGVVPAPPANLPRRGVQRLHMILTQRDYDRIQATAPPYLLEDTRLHMEISTAKGPIHPIVHEWACQTLFT